MYLHRLEASGESATTQFEAASVLNSIWFDLKLPAVRQFLQGTTDLPNAEIDTDQTQPNSRSQYPTAVDIFVKVFVSLSSTVKSTSISLESLIKLLSKKKSQPAASNRKQGGSNNNVNCEPLVIQPTGAWKKVLDYNLSPLSQILAVQFLSGSSVTLEEVDRFLSSLTFRLFTLFLQRSSETQIGTDHPTISSVNSNDQPIDLATSVNSTLSSTERSAPRWTASRLEITKTIRLLIETRPLSLSKSFVKHLYPYVNQVPKTLEDADLLSEVNE